MTDNTLISDLTVGQFKALMRATMRGVAEEMPQEPITQPTVKMVHGMQGFANLLGISKRYAHDLKASGEFDEAIIQVGRNISIYPDIALEIWARKNQLK